MALDYRGLLPILDADGMPFNIGTPLAADADGDNIYILSRKSSVDTIYTISQEFNRTGDDGGLVDPLHAAVIQSSVAIPFSGFNEGLARVGTGWAVGNSNNARLAEVRVFNSSGGLDTSFVPFVGSTSLTTFPDGLLYDPSTSRYLLFIVMNIGRFQGPHAISMDATGEFAVAGLFSLGASLGRIGSVTDHDDTYLIVFDNTDESRNIAVYDSGFNDTGTPVVRQDADTAADPAILGDLGVVLALASFDGRAVVVSNVGGQPALHLYGGDVFPTEVPPDPMPGDVGGSVRQLKTYYSYYQRFALATPGDAIDVKAHNFRAIQSTDVSLNLLPGTLSLEQRFSLVEVTPEWTIPSAKVGDKVFLWRDPDAPTEIPDSALEIKGFLKLGDSYRQTLVCQEPQE